VRNGTLFRFDRQTAGKVRDYFILDETDESELVSAPLDGFVAWSAAYSGDSNEPLRAILTLIPGALRKPKKNFAAGSSQAFKNFDRQFPPREVSPPSFLRNNPEKQGRASCRPVLPVFQKCEK
jgi:hypothetical protein